MFDTFHPLQVTAEAVAIEDPTYFSSWLPGRHNGQTETTMYDPTGAA